MNDISDKDIERISAKVVDLFEERLTGQMYKAAGKWLFGIIWKSVVTALLAFAAYSFGKNGG